ncbi:MAG: CoA-binding protein, partial [Actinomycetota bacterium]|nr:CoA-binding protein [Actinomycetota bacterium]
MGASRDPGKLGGAMLRSLAHFGGSVVGINPADPDPAEQRYASISDAVTATGHPIDLAVPCIPAARPAAALT